MFEPGDMAIADNLSDIGEHEFLELHGAVCHTLVSRFLRLDLGRLKLLRGCFDRRFCRRN